MKNPHPGKLIMGLDIGTTGMKGVVLDAAGKPVASAESETQLLYPSEGRVEMDPLRHADNVFDLIRELAARAGGNISALAIAGATGNTLLTDAQGEPLAPIINWMDRRCENACPSTIAHLQEKEVACITGWPCIRTFPLAHLAWLRENRPETWAGAAHFGMAADWLTRRLCGTWCLDDSSATPFHLQDQIGGCWHRPFLDLLNIPIDRLAALCPSGTCMGSVTPEAANASGLSPDTLLVSGSFDHPAAARAAGVLEPGQLLLSCGTSWVGFLPCANRDDVLKADMLCDPFLKDRQGPWGGIFSVPYIGTRVDWYVREVIAPGEADPWALFNELAAASSPGANGLSLDLRDQPSAPDASRADTARAVMEGAVRLLVDKLDALRPHGFRFHEAVMVGGPSESEVWAAVLAEMSGLKLTRGGRAAGARGAAMLAGIGLGLYCDEHEALEIWSKAV